MSPKGAAGSLFAIVEARRAAAAALGIFGLFAGAVAIAMGAATGSPAAARGAAALAAVASYLINALAQVTNALRPARPLSPYYLVLGNEPLAHGLRLTGAVAVLVAVAAIAALGSTTWLGWPRGDQGSSPSARRPKPNISGAKPITWPQNPPRLAASRLEAICMQPRTQTEPPDQP